MRRAARARAPAPAARSSPAPCASGSTSCAMAASRSLSVPWAMACSRPSVSRRELQEKLVVGAQALACERRRMLRAGASLRRRRAVRVSAWPSTKPSSPPTSSAISSIETVVRLIEGLDPASEALRAVSRCSRRPARRRYRPSARCSQSARRASASAPPARRRCRARASPTYRHFCGATPSSAAACSKGRGCGLRSGKVSPHTSETTRARNCSASQQRLGEPRGLVCHDAPRNGRLFQRSEQFGGAGKQYGVVCEALAVDRQESLAQHRELLLRRVGNPSRTSALAPCETNGRTVAKGSGFKVLLHAQCVHGCGHVGRGIEQGAVQIEKHGAVARCAIHDADSSRCRCIR